MPSHGGRARSCSLYGNASPYDARAARQVGADGNLPKPWDTQTMLEKVIELAGKLAGNVAKPGSAAAAAPAPAPAAAAPAAAAPPSSSAGRGGRGEGRGGGGGGTTSVRDDHGHADDQDARR